MKASIIIPLIGVLSSALTLADIPTKKALNLYRNLWDNSPFTTKKTEAPPPLRNPFDDYYLTGIAPLEDGYHITITHKKTKETVVIEPGIESKFKVQSVERNPEINWGTVVYLTDGSMKGRVKFEPELAKLNLPSSMKQQPIGQSPPGSNPNQQNSKNPTPGARPRIVQPINSNPPPTTSGQPPGTTGNQ